MIDTTKADFYRMTGKEWKWSLRCSTLFLCSHQIRYMYWWRKYKEHKGLIAAYKLYKIGRKYGLEFAKNAEIGPGIYLGHPYNITLGGLN